MGYLKPWAIPADPQNAFNRLTPYDARAALGAAFASSSTHSTVRAGVLPSGATVTDLPSDLRVGSVNAFDLLQSRVEAGMCVVLASRSLDGVAPWVTGLSSPETVFHPPRDATLPRIDLIALQVIEPGVDAAFGTNDAGAPTRVRVFAGAPASNPVAPTPNLNKLLPLSEAVIRPGANRPIAQADYTDRRIWTCTRGGTWIRVAGDNRRGAYRGEQSYNWVAGVTEEWDGNTWIQPGGGAWTEFTPQVRTDSGSIAAAQFATLRGRWRRNGGLVQVEYHLSPISGANWGHGRVIIKSPVSWPVTISHIGGEARLEVPGSNFRWHGSVELWGPDEFLMWFQESSVAGQDGNYQAANTSARNVGTGTPRISGQTSEGTLRIRISV